MNKILLQCDNLCKRYQEGSVQTDVLHNVSFSVGEGEMMAIVGSSGSGKSTLLHLLGGLDTQFTAPLPPREVQKDGFIGPTQFLPRIPQRQVYRHCRIEGDIDFIFGGAAAWFEDCDIVSIDGLRDHGDRKEPALGFCTAASTPEGQEFGYVFMKCRFQGEGVPDGAIYLVIPWREFAKTVLLHCELGAHIRPEGWHDWNKPYFPATGYYAEFASTGAGSQGQRAAYVHQLTAEEAEKYTFERFWTALSPEG